MNEDPAWLESANSALGPGGEAEWQRLQRQLEFADGFWLGFVFSAASLAIAALRQRTKQFFAEQRRPMRIVPLATPEAFRDVLPLLFEEASATAGCVWIEVMGVDPPRATNAGSGPWTAAWDELLLRMNERRDALRRHLKGGLVLVASPEMKPRTREAAPDLWSVRALVLELHQFASSQPNDTTILRKDFSNLALDELPKEAAPDVEFALQEAERIAQRDDVDPRAVATALLRTAYGLYSLDRFPEALAFHDKAISLYRRLIEQEGRSDLTRDFAAALTNQGLALGSQGHMPEALTCFNEAILLYRHLVEQEGSSDLTKDLAAILTSQGLALTSLDRLPEALACYNEAVPLYRHLIQQKWYAELADSLAMTLADLGLTLFSMHRLPEALAHFDEAIPLYRRLVEHERRTELTNDFARALVNQGAVLCSFDRLPEALARFDEAIPLWEQDIAGGMAKFTPSLLTALRNRFATYRRLGQWKAATADVVRALDLTKPFLEGDGLAELVRREWGQFVRQLRNLQPEEQQYLYAALGEKAEEVRRLVESPARAEE